MARKRVGLTNKQMKTLGLKQANPARVSADLELRRSNAGRPHDSRPHRQRSRRDSKRADISEQIR